MKALLSLLFVTQIYAGEYTLGSEECHKVRTPKGSLYVCRLEVARHETCYIRPCALYSSFYSGTSTVSCTFFRGVKSAPKVLSKGTVI